jgi:3-hydroxyisobutyrate dehydrogenase-like beta-hydroxyacid dehydrogenase
MTVVGFNCRICFYGIYGFKSPFTPQSDPSKPSDQTMSTRTIAILSPGNMGSGLGRLLRSKSIRVVTNLQGRSDRSRQRAESNGIEDVHSDVDLLSSAEVIISVLVPSFATATAQRIASASKKLDPDSLRTKFYIDANAIAPTTAKNISELFADTGITFIDGSIIGGPPRLKPDGTWYRPTIALSGPHTRDIQLDDVFDISHVGPDIGQASTLKMSFASLTKVL